MASPGPRASRGAGLCSAAAGGAMGALRQPAEATRTGIEKRNTAQRTFSIRIGRLIYPSIKGRIGFRCRPGKHLLSVDFRRVDGLPPNEWESNPPAPPKGSVIAFR